MFPAGDPGGLYRDDVSVVDRWWFWTIVGTVAITGIVVVGVVASSSPDPYQGNAGLVAVR